MVNYARSDARVFCILHVVSMCYFRKFFHLVERVEGEGMEVPRISYSTSIRAGTRKRSVLLKSLFSMIPNKLI